jgi:hypothetical protein
MAIVAAGFLASAPADAAPDIRYVQLNGSGMCTLSVPTTDTRVRPRATGFRNEGTTSAFVICNFTSLPGYDGSLNYGDPQAVVLLLYSIDGNDHAVTCTGVTSLQGFASIGANPQQYVTKTLTVNNTTDPYKAAGVAFKWLPADFGGTDSIPDDAAFSVTCQLPPQVAINVGIMQGQEEIGG